MTDILYILLAAIVMLPGLAGVVLPALPGIPYMWLVALGYGLLTRWVVFTTNELGILFAIALASVVVDYLSGVLGAKYSGASARAIGAGVIGLLIGTLLIPPFGGLLGLFIGVLYVEFKERSWQQAMRAATGSLAGVMAGIAINLLLSALFIGLFVFFALTG